MHARCGEARKETRLALFERLRESSERVRRLVSLAREHRERLDYFLDFRRHVYVRHGDDVKLGHAENLRKERRVSELNSLLKLYIVHIHTHTHEQKDAQKCMRFSSYILQRDALKTTSLLARIAERI